MVLEATSNEGGLVARILEVAEMLATVELSAQPQTSTLAEQLLHLGNVPLPPYIRREPTAEDIERYQTIYAQIEGSVAAPTAGLHFTERVLDALCRNGVEILDVVLHVGPGTFQPLRSENAAQHTMHAERILVERSTIARLRELVVERKQFCICVGTTSVRTVESLYWFGARLLVDPSAPPHHLTQEEPYRARLLEREISAEHALDALLDWLDRSGLSTLEASTQLYILPGYRYRIVDGMITNFHQPQSTLLLLVAAFIGPWWQTIYREALANNYRFLSYGDASLLIAPRTPTASR
jgi:S-adenosylmethionine:tRNA ribosyltransferase-isomerase